MAKTIDIEFEGKTYTLEYTRRTVGIMEDRGFQLREMGDKPMTVLPALFEGAFLAHHPYVKSEVVDKIFSLMPRKQELVLKLSEMYRDPVNTLLDEPEESEGNLNWEASW